VPGSLTEGESFLWHRPEPRIQIGLAYLWKQEAFRILGNYVLLEETATRPNLKVGAGIQSITTGNPGYYATTEKNFHLKDGTWSLYAGVGFRSNESHSHGIGGLRYEPHGPWAIGLQLDGHQGHPYLTHRIGNVVVGYYLADFEQSGYLVGIRF